MNAGRVAALAVRVRAEMGKVIVGQVEPIDQMLLAVIGGGHALLEGVPGLAKTLAVKTLARVCGVQFQRVQCTPDLMPADITGTAVYDPGRREFTLHRGPVFTDLLLVDEINRMPPRTQSALLEAMEERQVTIDGTGHALAPWFTVFATQNPVEFEGTYPLPEAQLDRFLMKIRVSYPDLGDEIAILQRHQEGLDPRRLDRVGLETIDPADLAAAREEMARVRVEPGLMEYVAAVARVTRGWAALTLGASPRATVNLLLVSKGIAAMEGRDFLIPDDVKAAAAPVLRHRLVLKPEADLEGMIADEIVASILASIKVPR
jgi:MoxR-like ATPase